MHYSSDEDEKDDSEAMNRYCHVKNRRHNRRYDGSRCYCQPCPECHGVWIPSDCHWGPICTDCAPPWGNFDGRSAVSDNASEREAFLSRIAAARALRARYHWHLMRRFVRMRSYAFYWLRKYAENRYNPERLEMSHEFASALSGFVL